MLFIVVCRVMFAGLGVFRFCLCLLFDCRSLLVLCCWWHAALCSLFVLGCSLFDGRCLSVVVGGWLLHVRSWLLVV